MDRNNTNLQKIIFWLQHRKSTLVLILCLLGSIYWITRGVRSEYQKAQTAETIAARFRVEPTWDVMVNYFGQSIQPGMTREEVHGVIEKIGSFRIAYADPTNEPLFSGLSNQHIYREVIEFEDRDVSKKFGKWSFRYDRNWVLIGFNQEFS